MKPEIAFEIWLKPDGAARATLLQAGQSFRLTIDGTTLSVLANGQTTEKKLAIDQSLKPGVWRHLAVNLGSKLEVLIDCELVLSLKCETTWEETYQSELVFCQEFVGSFTEIRLWKKSRTLEQIKEFMRTPLEIVAEQEEKAEIQINFERKPLAGTVATQVQKKDWEIGSPETIKKDDGLWSFGSPNPNVMEKVEFTAKPKHDPLAPRPKSKGPEPEPTPLKPDVEPDTILFQDLFKGHQFVPALLTSENTSKELEQLFKVNRVPSEFIKAVSLHLVKQVKNIRTQYLQGDYSGALRSCEEIFVHIKKNLDTIYLRLDAKPLWQLKAMLKRFLVYRLWVCGLQALQTANLPLAKRIISYLLGLEVMAADKSVFLYCTSCRYFTNSSSPAVLYELLALMRDLGKRECFTPAQLDQSKKMIKWAKSSDPNCASTLSLSSYVDLSGKLVPLYRHPEWFKIFWVDLTSFEQQPVRGSFGCTFCDSRASQPGDECPHCLIGKFQ